MVIAILLGIWLNICSYSLTDDHDCIDDDDDYNNNDDDNDYGGDDDEEDI